MRVSEYFNLGKTQAYLDFVDVPINTDIEVFIDPTEIKNLSEISLSLILIKKQLI